MHLKSLHLVNFKNYEQADLVLSERLNLFTGLNGSGKTNILDAVHYLALCKSFLHANDSQNIRYDEPFFVIQGDFASDSGVEQSREEPVYCGVKRGQRKVFKRNNKEYDRLADHIGLFPVVVVSPQDSVLITGGSEERRRFMDTVISQFNRSYLEQLINYNRVIVQRNALLKQMNDGKAGNDGTLEILDLQLVQFGTPIHVARRAFIRELLPFFNEFYKSLCDGKEEVELIYESRLNEHPLDLLLEEARNRDKMLLHTSVGIHKDDLSFSINGHVLKRSGSQGQQKTFLIALKLAEYVFLDRASGKKPLLLLDDLHDKLDAERVERLLQIVCTNRFGQLFISDTGAGVLEELFRKQEISFKAFEVHQGGISER